VTRVVRFHTDASADLARQVAWLERNAAPSWLDRLQDDVARAIQLLRLYPGAGARVEREADVVLRRVPLPSTPYVIWYIYNERRAQGDVWIVRLFHSRQKRPTPDPSRWFPALETEQ
jgi:plasmid stabilization system protein ParE